MDNHFNEEEFNDLISKYNYKEILHDTFKNVISPEFKRRGFKTKGKTFYKERDDIIEICTVQYSGFNHRTTASFTYNIGIAVPSFYESLNIHPVHKLETTVFTGRLGTIILSFNNIPSDGDYWYRLEAYSQPVEDSTLSELIEEENKQIKKIRAIFKKLDGRYNIKTGEGFNKVVLDDIENFIIKFFASIPNAMTLINNMNNMEPKGLIDENMMLRIAELYYYNGKEEKGRNIINKIQNGYYKELINRDVQEGKLRL